LVRSLYPSALSRPPPSPLFPYTTLFRSSPAGDVARHGRAARRSRVADLRRGGNGIQYQLAAAARAHSVREAELSRHQENEGDKIDRKSTRLNSSHLGISYAVFCLKKKKK